MVIFYRVRAVEGRYDMTCTAQAVSKRIRMDVCTGNLMIMELLPLSPQNVAGKERQKGEESSLKRRIHSSHWQERRKIREIINGMGE